MPVKNFALALILAIISINSFGQNPVPTYQRGVSINHWTSDPIEEWTLADRRWFSRKDVEWIAKEGFDHIQLYVSANEAVTNKYLFKDEPMKSVDSAIIWCRQNKLGVVLVFRHFDPFVADSTLPKAQQDSIFAEGRALFFNKVAARYKTQGDNVRMMISPEPTEQLPSVVHFYTKTLDAIFDQNKNVNVYVSFSAIDNIRRLEKYISNKHVKIAASLEGIRLSSDNPYTALNIFVNQHQPFYKFPKLSFPGVVPAIDSLSPERWSRNLTGATLNEQTIAAKLGKVYDWLLQNNINNEVYISNFRFYTGWPHDYATETDKRSIQNFAEAVMKYTRQYQFAWSVYDYNSGSCIRYADGRKALMLEYMNIKG
jgi:hypothetical protein